MQLLCFAGGEAPGSQTSTLMHVRLRLGGQSPPPHSRSLHESQRKGKASAQQSPGAEGTHGLHFFFAGEEPDSAATPTPLRLANEGECLNFSSFWWGAGECVCVCVGEKQ